jgi:hypothetical protein
MANERWGRDLACLQLTLFGRQECVAQFAEIQSLPRLLHARGPASMEIISLGLVEFKGLFPAIALDAYHLALDDLTPPAKVMDLAKDFFLPCATGMGCQREIGIRLLWSDGGSIYYRFTRAFFPGRLTHSTSPIGKWLGWRRLRRITTAVGNLLRRKTTIVV